MAREDPAIAVAHAEEVEVTEMEESEPSHVQEAKPLAPSSTLTLPSNATSIRADITDNFSCTNKTYGYYADVENDCQIFHVCLPVTYADGKENIFRWSFICPEETIFNQESFTCMRREDMTIECEDSYRYYELNGNFGAPVEEEKTQENEGDSKPIETEPMEEVAPAESVKPQPEIVKPVKVEKPKRKPSQGRPKPAVFYKQPVRKTPEQEVVQANEPVTAPKPQRVSVPIREKPLTQNQAQSQSQSQSHPTSKPVRGDFFLSQRKRNKPSSTTTTTTTVKPLREDAITVSFEAEPTLEVETLFEEPQPVVVKSEEPLAEASEPAVVLVAQPEEIHIEEDQTKPLQDEETTKQQEQQDAQPIEAIEEIPAVIVESFEAVKKPQVDEEEDTKEELKIIENEKEDPEEEKEIEEEKEEPAKVLEITKEPEQTPLEPAIEESTNSQEESSNQIEELEAQKPQNAPESMPATEAMEQPNPLVDEILNTDSPNNEAQQSLGGFKPVDPVMAAEAEQLITDFLNTLKKTEEKTETELAMEMAETLDKEDKEKPHEEPEGVSVEELKLPEPEIVDKNASVEEQLLEEEQKLKQDSPIINIMQLSHPEDYQIPVQIVTMEKEPITEIDIKPLDDKEELPAAAAEVEPQQIPIQHDENQESLVTAAYMPPISIDDIVELVKERLDQTPKTEQMAPMELVLTPGAEEPMALIASSGQNQNQSQDDDKQQESSSSPIVQNENDNEKEDIILPIYKRITNADLAMANLQTLPVTSSKGDTETKTETEPEKAIEFQPEVREPKSKLKMDARKRRFLFRADAS
ncbi:probable serine/threonine-protein kinase kinX [Drosophila tropicalis]|uniref:probable serine/threonine-protein kinase kinX n=1 Tax=Drosophila tropicalis TaxID=46794 RepID=UPI0035AB80E2